MKVTRVKTAVVMSVLTLLLPIIYWAWTGLERPREPGSDSGPLAEAARTKDESAGSAARSGETKTDEGQSGAVDSDGTSARALTGGLALKGATRSSNVQHAFDPKKDPIGFLHDISQRDLTPGELQELLPLAKETIPKLAAILQSGDGREPIRAVRALESVGEIFSDLAPSVLGEAETALVEFYVRERDPRARLTALGAIGQIDMPSRATMDTVLGTPPDNPAVQAELYSILPKWFDIDSRAKDAYVAALRSPDRDTHIGATFGIAAAIAADPSICETVLAILEEGVPESASGLLLELSTQDLQEDAEIRFLGVAKELASDRGAVEVNRDTAIRILLSRFSENGLGGLDGLSLCLHILADPDESENLRATVMKRLKVHNIKTEDVLATVKSVVNGSNVRLSEKARGLLKSWG